MLVAWYNIPPGPSIIEESPAEDLIGMDRNRFYFAAMQVVSPELRRTVFRSLNDQVFPIFQVYVQQRIAQGVFRNLDPLVLSRVLLGIALLFFVIPRVDPLRDNIQKFRGHYEGFMIVLILFMIAIELQILLWGIGTKISPNLVLPIGVGFLIFYAGILIGHAKRNWFIGIRTPWTLSSDAVWDETHRVGSTLFIASGLIALLGIPFPKYALWLVLGPILASTVFLLFYSYFLYQKEING